MFDIVLKDGFVGPTENVFLLVFLKKHKAS